MQLLVPALVTIVVSAAVAALVSTAALPTSTASVPAGVSGTPLTIGAESANGTTGTPRARTNRAQPVPAPTATGVLRPNLAVTASFTWPLSPRPSVHRRFEQPRDDWSRGHRGVDLLTAVGQPVLSSGDGVIAFSGVVAGRGVTTVRHAGGLRTTYEPVDARLASGTLVRRGARIGTLAPAPGHCTPLACLHWGAIFGHTYRDPLTLLGFGRPILLPLG